MTRWGILATGGIAARFVEDLRLLPDAEVLAVGSRSAPSAQAFADRYGIPQAYGSWAELAADDKIDVIYVATPHSAHHAATLTCLRAGRAVLCEKPFTLDLATSTELVQTARDQDLFLMEAMWMRCNPTVRRVVELIGDGAIGEVTAVHADFGLAGPFAPESRLRNPALGGGALLDLGVYPISLAHLILGRPDEIRSWAKLTPEGVDENTGVLLGYDSGAVAALTCGLVGATRVAATVTGTTGRIELPDPFFCPNEFTIRRGDGEPEAVRVVEPAGNGYQYEAAEVHRCLAAGLRESPLVPHAVTLEVMELLDTIRNQIGVDYR
ncbi:Gfo/Idh/MocA family oxidoreductase [Solwaraspora sp. WMMD406]|uniref:Gfo/Idh/MocA family protein n=1 Tax=Solwaraspora sp. WMMD406 TaxID=3016095 RepID=UPI002417EDDA|nr:Gfo/Idh/MocA family oxidoreductase [Solwaraspora sp. WMMD406]MDG4768248.1 Gfo/Idh/MocA family oxidoreductase [Solwaraspora sp. WMMD406]